MIEEERVEASGEGKRRVFRAFDSWEEPDPKEFAGKEKKPKRLGADREYFLDRNEVFPLEGAWRNSEGAWVYLPLAESDQGFDSVAKMMPLWIYRGKFEPELLLENKWKFLGRAPELFENVEDLPRLIVRFLERLLNTEAVSDEDVPDKNRAELERKNPFSGGNSEAPLLESRGEKRGSDPQRLRLEEEAEAGIKSKKARASDEEFSEIPEIEKEYGESGLIKAEETIMVEETLTTVLFVVDMGPDCYKDESRFPSGPYCKKGDFILIRPNSGT